MNLRDHSRTAAAATALLAGALALTACSAAPDDETGKQGRPAASAAPTTSAPREGGAADNRALLAAAKRGDAAAVRAALQRGADPETRDSHRRTPLLLAALEDHVEAARVLVEAGADPDAQDDRRDSAWLVTGVTGSVPMAKLLIGTEPDLTLTNRFGGISVIPASERGHVDYVRYVTEQTDTDVDHVNDLGWTALLEAVILGDGGRDHQEVVRLLLAAGADRGIPDKDGVTALQHARNRGFTELARILQ